MNSTQKSAWLMLGAVLLSAVVAAYMGSILTSGRIPPRPLGQIVVGSVVLGGLALFVLIIFLITKRQSRMEPESDERDKAIMKNAVLASFVADWVLLALVVLILGLTLGQTGSVPVYVMTLIFLGVGVMTMLVYGVAILAQYGRATKEVSHE